MGKHGIQFSVSSSGDVAHRRHDENVRLQTSIGTIAIRKLAYQRQVKLDPGLWQSQEKERSAINAALIAAGRLSNQAT